MKIILSRKGFDSANGGITSPIFEDGTILSFPIPSDDKDTYEDLQYKGKNYTDILKELHYKGNTQSCHIDPDLSLARRKASLENWCPVFGQINSSASYLLNTVKIDVGDVFLFFGNFHHVKMVDGKYKYVSRTNDFYMDKDLQLIWGYLQVGKIITDAAEQRKYAWHPHSNDKRTNDKSNVMFVASDTLSFNKSMPGAGILNYSIERVLTAPNANKATWIKKDVYDVNSVIGKRKNLSRVQDGIYYAGIWQELGLQETVECEEWARRIIEA